MRIERFEDIEAWQLGRELTRDVYAAIDGSERFSKDWALRNQITRAPGSIMHNVAEGFDADGNREFIRFLKYSKRSCSEVQSELYVALDQRYICQTKFEELYALAGRARAALKGFIRYLHSNLNT